MTEDDQTPTAAEPEILTGNPPDSSEGTALLLAHVTNFTQRPDLFLAEVEKHDPGFTKRINEHIHRNSERERETRFFFRKNSGMGFSGNQSDGRFSRAFLSVSFGHE